jgi:SAM-dependent methyltransferase
MTRERTARENGPVPADYFVIAESEHELQNPTSQEKLLLLGRRLELGPESRVLDVASGRGGPALLFASEFGCSVQGIELRPDFHSVAVERAESAGLSDRVRFELGDAAEAAHGSEEYDVAMCLGASFVWGGLAGTLDVLEPVARAGGHVVVGEPYWRRVPLPQGYAERNEPFTTLAGTVQIFESGTLGVVAVIASSEDDWDRYETLHWAALERWLSEHLDDPDAPDIRATYVHWKRTYLEYGRDYLGWALFAGWKRPS